jgi:hypothetical protein
MPKVSRETASETIALDGLDVRLEHLEGGYSVCFESHTADADLADLFRGLADDRCQLPRWGYVVRGKVAFRFADREETYEAGDAYSCRPATRLSTTREPRSSISAPRTSSGRRSEWSWRTSAQPESRSDRFVSAGKHRVHREERWRLGRPRYARRT